MANQPTTPAPISPLALTERQLTDWQTLHAQLDAEGADADQLDYCEEKIGALLGEIYELKAARIQQQIDELPINRADETYQRYNELRNELNAAARSRNQQ